jgi:hypothetical protein
MTKFPCPSCGADIVFRTSIAAYSICPYCRTMVVRSDDGIKGLGTVAQLPDDMSPFQLGAGGVFDGVHFGIVGRLRIGWEDGAWNEWFMVSDDARKGWLAEAQGFYAPCFDVTKEINEDELKSVNDLSTRYAHAMDRVIKLKGKHYRIVDIKAATCIGSEGELPFLASKGRKTTSIDLVGGDKLFASIEIADEGNRVFMGRYVEWEELRCSNFRHFEDW